MVVLRMLNFPLQMTQCMTPFFFVVLNADSFQVPYETMSGSFAMSPS